MVDYSNIPLKDRICVFTGSGRERLDNAINNINNFINASKNGKFCSEFIASCNNDVAFIKEDCILTNNGLSVKFIDHGFAILDRIIFEKDLTKELFNRGVREFSLYQMIRRGDWILVIDMEGSILLAEMSERFYKMDNMQLCQEFYNIIINDKDDMSDYTNYEEIIL